MTPDILIAQLKSLPPDLPVVFETPDGPVNGGYHVTEFKRHHIDSIDCGQRVSNWSESSIQILDGKTGEHMATGKLAAILAQSARVLDGAGDTPMHVEFGHGNSGLRRYAIAEPVQRNRAVHIRLSDTRATCKPLSLSHLVPACCG